MQVTVNLEDLSSLTFLSTTGEEYHLVRKELIETAENRMDDLIAKSQKKLVNQKELRELYKCGQARIKKWVSWGLREIPDGKSVLYDLDELELLLKDRKI